MYQGNSQLILPQQLYTSRVITPPSPTNMSGDDAEFSIPTPSAFL
jgi:hypothetical protein